MLSAVCADVFVQLTEGIAAAVGSAGSPLDALAEAGRCYVQFGLEHPEHYRLVAMRPPFKDDVVDRRTSDRSWKPARSRSRIRCSAVTPSPRSQAFKALYDLVDAVLAAVPKLGAGRMSSP